MSKTDFEKAVIIRMRRLRKKKALFEKMQQEMGEEEFTKEKAREYIEKAGDLAINERKEINAKQKLH